MLTKIVQSYYKWRYANHYPDARQALYWLITEVVELVKAWLETAKPSLTPAEAAFFEQLIRLGEVAENIVQAEHDWVRNNDRVKAPNLAFEVGDALMMLTVFAIQSGVADPEICMKSKMKSKGWPG